MRLLTPARGLTTFAFLLLETLCRGDITAFSPPLEVLSIIPGSGSLSEKQSIVVVFNIPVVSLLGEYGNSAEAAAQGAPFQVKADNAIGHHPGKLYWVSSSIARFDPATVWFPDLRITVSVNTDLVSISGQKLQLPSSTSEPPPDAPPEFVKSPMERIYSTPSLTWNLHNIVSESEAASWSPAPNPRGKQPDLWEYPKDSSLLLRFNSPVVPSLLAAPGTLIFVDDKTQTPLQPPPSIVVEDGGAACGSSPKSSPLGGWTLENSGITNEELSQIALPSSVSPCVKITLSSELSSACSIMIAAAHRLHPFSGLLKKDNVLPSYRFIGTFPFQLEPIDLGSPAHVSSRHLRMYVRHGYDESFDLNGFARLFSVKDSATGQPPTSIRIATASQDDPTLVLSANFMPGKQYLIQANPATPELPITDAKGNSFMGGSIPIVLTSNGGFYFKQATLHPSQNKQDVRMVFPSATGTENGLSYSWLVRRSSTHTTSWKAWKVPISDATITAILSFLSRPFGTHGFSNSTFLQPESMFAGVTSTSVSKVTFDLSDATSSLLVIEATSCQGSDAKKSCWSETQSALVTFTSYELDLTFTERSSAGNSGWLVIKGAVSDAFSSGTIDESVGVKVFHARQSTVSQASTIQGQASFEVSSNPPSGASVFVAISIGETILLSEAFRAYHAETPTIENAQVFSSGDLRAHVSSDRTFYVPGEEFAIQGFVAAAPATCGSNRVGWCSISDAIENSGRTVEASKRPDTVAMAFQWNSESCEVLTALVSSMGTFIIEGKISPDVKYGHLRGVSAFIGPKNVMEGITCRQLQVQCSPDCPAAISSILPLRTSQLSLLIADPRPPTIIIDCCSSGLERADLKDGPHRLTGKLDTYTGVPLAGVPLELTFSAEVPLASSEVETSQEYARGIDACSYGSPQSSATKRLSLTTSTVTTTEGFDLSVSLNEMADEDGKKQVIPYGTKIDISFRAIGLTGEEVRAQASFFNDRVDEFFSDFYINPPDPVPGFTAVAKYTLSSYSGKETSDDALNSVVLTYCEENANQASAPKKYGACEEHIEKDETGDITVPGFTCAPISTPWTRPNLKRALLYVQKSWASKCLWLEERGGGARLDSHEAGDLQPSIYREADSIPQPISGSIKVLAVSPFGSMAYFSGGASLPSDWFQCSENCAGTLYFRSTSLADITLPAGMQSSMLLPSSIPLTTKQIVNWPPVEYPENNLRVEVKESSGEVTQLSTPGATLSLIMTASASSSEDITAIEATTFIVDQSVLDVAPQVLTNPRVTFPPYQSSSRLVSLQRQSDLWANREVYKNTQDHILSAMNTDPFYYPEWSLKHPPVSSRSKDYVSDFDLTSAQATRRKMGDMTFFPRSSHTYTCDRFFMGPSVDMAFADDAAAMEGAPQAGAPQAQSKASASGAAPPQADDTDDSSVAVTRPRSDFKRLVKAFKTTLTKQTDGSFSGAGAFTLPDNEGKFSIRTDFVVSRQTELSWGRAPELSVISNLPAYLKAALPRFLRAGDIATFGVKAFHESTGDGSVTRSVTLDAVEGIGLYKSQQQSTSKALKMDKLVESAKWTWEARQIGEARLTFQLAESGTDSTERVLDAITVTLDILPPTNPVTMSSTLAINPEAFKASEQLVIDEGLQMPELYPSIGGVKASASVGHTSALIQFAEQALATIDTRGEATSGSTYLALAQIRKSLADTPGFVDNESLFPRIDKHLPDIEKYICAPPQCSYNLGFLETRLSLLRSWNLQHRSLNIRSTLMALLAEARTLSSVLTASRDTLLSHLGRDLLNQRSRHQSFLANHPSSSVSLIEWIGVTEVAMLHYVMGAVSEIPSFGSLDRSSISAKLLYEYLRSNSDVRGAARFFFALYASLHPPVDQSIIASLIASWRTASQADFRIQGPTGYVAGSPTSNYPLDDLTQSLILSVWASNPSFAQHQYASRLALFIAQGGANAQSVWSFGMGPHAMFMAAVSLTAFDVATSSDDPNISLTISLGAKNLIDEKITSTNKGPFTAEQNWERDLTSSPASPYIKGEEAKVRYAVSGVGTVFTTLSAEFCPVDPAVRPTYKGFLVQKRILPFDQGKGCHGDNMENALPGDVVCVMVSITVKDWMRNVIIDDLSPAGLEPTDPLLSSTPASVFFAGRQTDISEFFAYPWWPSCERQTRKNQVTWQCPSLSPGEHTFTYQALVNVEGSYLLPPAHAFQEENPGVMGLSGAGVFTVGEKGALDSGGEIVYKELMPVNAPPQRVAFLVSPKSCSNGCPPSSSGCDVSTGSCMCLDATDGSLKECVGDWNPVNDAALANTEKPNDEGNVVAKSSLLIVSLLFSFFLPFIASVAKQF